MRSSHTLARTHLKHSSSPSFTFPSRLFRFCWSTCYPLLSSSTSILYRHSPVHLGIPSTVSLRPESRTLSALRRRQLPFDSPVLYVDAMAHTIAFSWPPIPIASNISFSGYFNPLRVCFTFLTPSLTSGEGEGILMFCMSSSFACHVIVVFDAVEVKTLTTCP